MQAIETISGHYSNSTEITIPSLKDFVQLFEPTTRTVFVKRKRSRPDPEDFFFLPKDSFIYKTKCEKYETIQEYLDSIQAGFASANEYKLYLKSAAKTSLEYKELRTDGFFNVSNKESFQQLKLEDLFQNLGSIIAKDFDRAVRLHFGDLRTRGDLLRFATSREVQSGKELEKYLRSDFSHLPKWKTAHECGFSSEGIYDEAVKKGFSNKEDFSMAQKLGILRDREYQKYKDDSRDAEERGFSVLEFYFLEDSYNQNKFHPRLKNIYSSITSNFKTRYGDSVHLNETIAHISSYTELYKHLKAEPHFSELIGTVDGFFNSVPVQYPNRAVIDASNVCYAQRDAEVSNARVWADNLLKMKEILEIYGFNRLLFIADANLPHNVEDPEVLEELEDSGLLYYSHGEQADKHLLEYSQPDTVIISNDQFRDWNPEGEYRRIGFSYDSKMGFDLM